jgi:hypothetical protein
MAALHHRRARGRARRRRRGRWRRWGRHHHHARLRTGRRAGGAVLPLVAARRGVPRRQQRAQQAHRQRGQQVPSHRCLPKGPYSEPIEGSICRRCVEWASRLPIRGPGYDSAAPGFKIYFSIWGVEERYSFDITGRWFAGVRPASRVSPPALPPSMRGRALFLSRRSVQGAASAVGVVGAAGDRRRRPGSSVARGAWERLTRRLRPSARARSAAARNAACWGPWRGPAGLRGPGCPRARRGPRGALGKRRTSPGGAPPA